MAQKVKNLSAMQDTWVWSLGREEPLGAKEMATHSSIFAWRIPWMKQPGRLQSMGWQRVVHDWATSLHFNMILEIFIKFKVLSSHYIVLLFYRMPIKIQLFSMYWGGEQNLCSVTYIFPHSPFSKKYNSRQEKKNPWSNVAVCDETFGLTTLSSRESFKLPH